MAFLIPSWGCLGIPCNFKNAVLLRCNYLFLNMLSFCGAHFGPPAAILSPSSGCLGPSWGPSWGHLGAILGLSGTIFVPSWTHLGRIRAILEPLGTVLTVLGLFWGYLRHILRLFCGNCGPSWDYFRVIFRLSSCIWGHLGEILKLFWAVFKPS